MISHRSQGLFSILCLSLVGSVPISAQASETVPETFCRGTLPYTAEVELGLVAGDPLYGVTSGFRRSDGTIVLANTGTEEILFYDPLRWTRTVVGGTGAGPGEFVQLQGVWPLGDSAVTGYDFRNSRIAVFDTAGAYLDGASLAVGSGVRWPAVVGPLLMKTLVAINGQDFDPNRTPGVYRAPFEFLNVSLAGDIIDTIYVDMGQEYVVSRGRPIQPLAFGATIVASSNGMSVVVAHQRTGLLRVLGEREKVIAAEPLLPWTRRHISDTVQRRLVDFAAERSDDPRALRSRYEDHPFPTSSPLLEEVVIGQDERIWISEYTFPWEPSREWVILNADGEPSCHVRLSRNRTVLWSDAEFVLFRDVDELGLESVTLGRLLQPLR